MLVVSGINFSKKNLVANQQRKNANATQITQLGRQTFADTFQPAFKANIPNLFNPIEKEAERLLKYIDIENNPYDYARMVVKETKRHPDQVNILYELAKKMCNFKTDYELGGFYKYQLPNKYKKHHLEIVKEAFKRKPDIIKVETRILTLNQPNEIIGLLKKGFIDNIDNIDNNLDNMVIVCRYNDCLASIRRRGKQPKIEAADMIRKSTINYIGEKPKRKYTNLEMGIISHILIQMNGSRIEKKDLILENALNTFISNKHKGLSEQNAAFKEILRIIKENYGDCNFADCKKMLEKLPD